YDNFLRPTNADPLAPWVAAQGNWAISGGALQGSDLDEGAYDDAYVAGDWTNFSVQAQIQIPAGGFGAGLDGRVNPLNGAKYTVIVYPNGIPGETTSPLMRLLKFHGWQVLGPSPMQQVVLPPVGTNGTRWRWSSALTRLLPIGTARKCSARWTTILMG